ncbi:hypothetical protein H4J46_15210 [Colwellia sp. MB02u-6]|nr:hypothetical protein [Colwellia sp. MB02u-6]MBA6329274.1 hypothetical protein [Colwellia sp. MB02u-6]
MVHEEAVNVIELSVNAMVMPKTIEQQLTDANDEIADLKMKIVWLKRSYE